LSVFFLRILDDPELVRIQNAAHSTLGLNPICPPECSRASFQDYGVLWPKALDILP